MRQLLDVHIGEVKIAKHGEILKAILGSCVGIGFIWDKNEKCGLAHCLLPKQPKKTYKIGAKYVDQAVSSLVAMLKIPADETANVKAVVVGGGNMTNGDADDTSKLVGSCNFKNAMDEVQSRGFNIVHSDGGGNLGRKIVIDGAALTFDVEAIPRISGLNAQAPVQ